MDLQEILQEGLQEGHREVLREGHLLVWPLVLPV